VFFLREIADQVRNEGVGSVIVIFASQKGAFPAGDCGSSLR